MDEIDILAVFLTIAVIVIIIMRDIGEAERMAFLSRKQAFGPGVDLPARDVASKPADLAPGEVPQAGGERSGCVPDCAPDLSSIRAVSRDGTAPADAVIARDSGLDPEPGRPILSRRKPQRERLLRRRQRKPVLKSAILRARGGLADGSGAGPVLQ